MNCYVQLSFGLTAMFIVSCAFATQPSMPVASQGETLVTATTTKLAVQVTIKTHEMQIGKPSDGRPAAIQSNCTYSKYPCSIVDRVDINVNGNPLFIPRSAFSDLADLYKAELQTNEKGSVLTLYGGDAAESYIVKIEFDMTHVTRRSLTSAESPSQPLQETIYHQVFQ
jgi:hypothetical protein